MSVKTPEPTPDQSWCDLNEHMWCDGYTEDESESCMCECHEDVDGIVYYSPEYVPEMQHLSSDEREIVYRTSC